MDVRLTAEQPELRDAAASLADDLGPGSVADLDDDVRRRAAGEDGRGDRLAHAALRRGLRRRGRHRRRGVRPRAGRRPLPRPRARRRPAPRRLRPAMRLGHCARRRGPRPVDDRRRRRGRGRPGDERALTLAGTGCWPAGRADSPGVDLTRSQRRGARPARAGRRAVRRRTPPAGTRWPWSSRPRTWWVPPAARTRWPATTRRSASSTAQRSAPTRPSLICSPRAWR